MKTYGLLDSSNAHLTTDQKDTVVREVLKLFNPSGYGTVSRDEWMSQTRAGFKLPDFGYGPGHHGDLEYEYEIHHFERFHGEGAKEEDLTHPEDIEHFRLHDEMELAEERLQQLESMQIVEGNIPRKFLRTL
jgi:CRISPR/Cas system-associated endonuclease/helicase Cas3